MTAYIKKILQTEGAIVLFASLYFYNMTGYSWWWFGLFLLFDVSLLGYVANKKVGSQVYNIGHSYVLPLLVLVVSVEVENSLFVALSFMWLSHIGFDRMQGYGLKEEKGFTHTHLGIIDFNRKKPVLKRRNSI